MKKAWLYVGITSFFELTWIFGFNVASTWWHWIIIVALIIVDFHYLAKACEGLPTGTVYAVFAGVGTVGTTLMDVWLFDQQLGAGKLLFIFILVIGVIGLQMADTLDEKRKVKLGEE